MLNLYIAVSLFVVGLVGLAACLIDFAFGNDHPMWGAFFVLLLAIGFRELRFELQRDVREAQ